MGGLSPEREVSIVTGNSVLEAINRKGLIALPIHVDHNIGETLKSNPIDLLFWPCMEPLERTDAFRVCSSISKFLIQGQES